MPQPLRQRAVQKAWDSLPGVDDDEQLLEFVEILATAGARLDSHAKYGSTLLQRISRFGSYESCCYLVNHGAIVNHVATEFYGTPLQEALGNKHVKIAELLLEHGADVNALPATYCGVTVLEAASINSTAYVAAPAAPHHRRTATDGAAERSHRDMVQLLLNAYAQQEEEEDLRPVCTQAAEYAEKEDHTELAQ
ncbi:ankyrin repeat-containing domain protein [Aspergillus granulosus]|uniref:Ankyrin repeat-containing domain protein n=1 Tax=Aspergillus granulosus TaxID=176169 RepID=A0ABR4HDM6_9EURO